MATTLLTTKLFIPSLRSERVNRARLVERLNAGLRGRLTLLSAPAGFGKTSLLSEWAAECRRAVAWVSLDEGDDNSALFLSYLITALQRIDQGIGKASLAALHATQPPPVDSLLTGLINDIAAISRPCLLMLDDYHQINDQAVHDAIVFLLEHQPPQMHLAISTRADPPWPLARLRSRGEMTELRSGELRFTPGETATFLNEVMGLGLSPEQVDMLDSRVEGWVAGLQMAALSMQGKNDASQFINSFTGSHRFILDYLVEEVLDRQTPEIREFMLRTSILSRLSGPLCDAVTERNNSHLMLAQLEQDNLFVMPLDDERRWYRYYHLFANLLQQRLQQTHGDLLTHLHRRAIDWYEAEALIDDAINHALAASDIQQVARLAEGNVLGMMERGEVGILARWLKALPDEVVHSYPWLCVACAWALAHAGRFEESDRCLLLLEDELMPAVKLHERSHVSGHINAIRLYNASLTGLFSEEVSGYAQNALFQLPDSDTRTRGLVAVLYGIVQRMNHEYASALKNLRAALAQSKVAGEKYAIVDLYCQIARVESQQGALRQAAATSRQAIQLAEQYGQGGHRLLPVVSYAHQSLAAILHEWNRLEEAEGHVERAIALSRNWGHFDSWVGSQRLLAQIYLSYGRWPDALNVIQDIKLEYSAASDWTEQTETLIRLASGDVEYAARWSEERGLSFHRDISLFSLLDDFLLARIRVAQFQHGMIDSLDDVLARLKTIYEQMDALNGERTCITALVLQAKALQVLGKKAPALETFSRALRLAAPEGYVRTLIDEGAPIADLLKAAVASADAPSYAGQLLEILQGDGQMVGSLAEEDGRGGERRTRDQQPSHSSGAVPGIIEPLSQRELQILRLLPTALSTTEIGRELHIAPSTVRSHIKSIYSKMDVHRRVAAVTRARELGLI